jgi:hypothetical protein
MACGVLHNMCIRNNVVLEEDDIMEDDEERDVDERPHPANASGIQTRRRLIENFA